MSDTFVLVDETIPEGGLNSAPVFLFDSTFALGGFEKQNTQYVISVVPEPSTFALAVVGLVGLAAARPRRRLRRRGRRRRGRH